MHIRLFSKLSSIPRSSHPTQWTRPHTHDHGSGKHGRLWTPPRTSCTQVTLSCRRPFENDYSTSADGVSCSQVEMISRISSVIRDSRASSYLSLQDEHNKTMARIVPRKMTLLRAIIATSVAPMWLIFSWTVTPWIRLIRKDRRLSTMECELRLKTLDEEKR